MILTKTSVLKKLAQVYCRLEISQIAGIGVVAIRPIPKGTNPFQGCDDSGAVEFDIQELKVDERLVSYVQDMCLIKGNKIAVPIVGLNRLDVSYYLNHSKKPNLGSPNGSHFYAIRDIGVGEELTINYKNVHKGTWWAKNVD